MGWGQRDAESSWKKWFHQTRVEQLPFCGEMSRAEAINPGNDVIHAALASSISQHISDSSGLKDQTSLWQQELDTARPGSDFS